MDYIYLEPMVEKLEYEEHVRWLQGLYGKRAKSDQPGIVTRLANHLLFILGSNLVSLGQRMQSLDMIHASSSSVK